MLTPQPVPEPRDVVVDIIAEDDVKVEIQQETGFKDKYKLYVHAPDGHPILRVCKLRGEDIELNLGLALEKKLESEQPRDYKFVDFSKLEQQCKDAIGNIPQYRRTAIWAYIEALRGEIAYVTRQRDEVRLHYHQKQDG